MGGGSSLAPAATRRTWTYHPEAFGWYSRGSFGGVQMFSYDVNGDGLNDVLAVMSAHGFGLAWFEQKRDAAGKISFVQHPIMGGEGYGAKAAGGVIFSQAHAADSRGCRWRRRPRFHRGQALLYAPGFLP